MTAPHDDNASAPEQHEAPPAGAAAATPKDQPDKKRLKWEPIAAMAAVLIIGVWLVVSLQTKTPHDLRENATTFSMRFGMARGLIERAPADAADPNGEVTYRLLFRNGATVGPLDAEAFRERFGETALEAVDPNSQNIVFKVLNITTWTSLVWVLLGFAGQAAFFGRMAVQWVISEREGKSVVPPVFWYLSLGGGVLLFTYFVWRQDVVGVVGQTTGVVIYARNIRLLYKERRRERRRAGKPVS
jgi:lipid-A-disaccharide synthase-like uncharacterized protein